MRIRTLNKRRKRLNKYKMFLLAHMYSVIKFIRTKDLLTETPGFRMYVSHLNYIHNSKKYKQFYYEMQRDEQEYKNKSKTT